MSPGAIDDLVERVAPDGPDDCDGWVVDVVGAATGGTHGVSQRTAKGVKAFWEAYLNECQGELGLWDQRLPS